MVNKRRKNRLYIIVRIIIVIQPHSSQHSEPILLLNPGQHPKQLLIRPQGEVVVPVVVVVVVSALVIAVVDVLVVLALVVVVSALVIAVVDVLVVVALVVVVSVDHGRTCTSIALSCLNREGAQSRRFQHFLSDRRNTTQSQLQSD